MIRQNRLALTRRAAGIPLGPLTVQGVSAVCFDPVASRSTPKPPPRSNRRSSCGQAEGETGEGESVQSERR